MAFGVKGGVKQAVLLIIRQEIELSKLSRKAGLNEKGCKCIGFTRDLRRMFVLEIVCQNTIFLQLL